MDPPRKRASARAQSGSPPRPASFGLPTAAEHSPAHLGGRSAPRPSRRGRHHLGGTGNDCRAGASVRSHPPGLLGGRHSKMDSGTSVPGPRHLGAGGNGQALGPNRPSPNPRTQHETGRVRSEHPATSSEAAPVAGRPPSGEQPPPTKPSPSGGGGGSGTPKPSGLGCRDQARTGVAQGRSPLPGNRQAASGRGFRCARPESASSETPDGGSTETATRPRGKRKRTSLLASRSRPPATQSPSGPRSCTLRANRTSPSGPVHGHRTRPAAKASARANGHRLRPAFASKGFGPRQRTRSRQAPADKGYRRKALARVQRQRP